MVSNMNPVKIIPLSKAYLEFLRQTRNHLEINKYMVEDVKISRQAQEKWYQGYLTRKDIKVFIALLGKEPVGYSQIRHIEPKHKSCELVFAIAPQFQGQGLGKQLCQQTVDYALRKLKMHRLWLGVLLFNQRAIKLYQQCGFKQEGILREAIFKQSKFYDLLIMSLIKNK